MDRSGTHNPELGCLRGGCLAGTDSFASSMVGETSESDGILTGSASVSILSFALGIVMVIVGAILKAVATESREDV